jgi:hypothetical protein
MSYTKPVQTPFAPNLVESEFVVLLDSGDFVAISAAMSVEPNSGNAVCQVSARAVDAAGLTRMDAATPPQPISSGWSHMSNPDEIAATGSIGEIQKQCMLAVLGEPTTLWGDPIHSTTLVSVSIRTNLGSAAHAGPVTDLSTLL